VEQLAPCPLTVVGPIVNHAAVEHNTQFPTAGMTTSAGVLDDRRGRGRPAPRRRPDRFRRGGPGRQAVAGTPGLRRRAT
jgi:hypothetical protein